jgi:hypothetical protein
MSRTPRKSAGGKQLQKSSFGFLPVSQIPQKRGDVPSANPNDSTTGIIDLIVKNEVPSFISSETILPLLLATTPYTLPSTSVEA